MKSYCIIGPSGVGKTYTLKTAFGVSGGYGALGVCGGKRNIATIGNKQFIPELKRIAKFRAADNSKIEEGYRNLLQNDYISFIDVGPYVSYCIPYAKELTDCTVVAIRSDYETILRNLLSRKVQDNGKNRKREVAYQSAKSLDRFYNKADMLMTQQDLITLIRTANESTTRDS